MKYKIVIALLLMLGLVVPAFTADKLAVSDDALFDMVRRKLTSDALVKGGTLDVTVKDGVVTLRGKVENQKQKDRATKLSKKVKGVKSVNNELTVSTAR